VPAAPASGLSNFNLTLSHVRALKNPVAKNQALKTPVGKNQLLQASFPGHLVWVNGLARLVNARGGLARVCVSNSKELTKGSGSA